MPLFAIIGSLLQHTNYRDLSLETTKPPISVISSGVAANSREVCINVAGRNNHHQTRPVISRRSIGPRRVSPVLHRSLSAAAAHLHQSPRRPSPASQHRPSRLHSAASHVPGLVHQNSGHASPPQHPAAAAAAAAAAGVRIGPDGGVDYDGGATANNQVGATAGQVANNPNLSQERTWLLSDINADRARYGLAPLQENSTLNNEAEHRSTDMIQRNYFSHLIPDSGQGHYFMQELPYAVQHYGENVAENTYIKQGMSQQQVMAQTEEDFMNSPGHRTNVLDSNFDNVGLGVAYTPQGQLKLTEDFTN